jgi:hypothetical protein
LGRKTILIPRPLAAGLFIHILLLFPGVYVTIDVFGTVRSRAEWFVANNEILRAKTSIEVLAVDHLTGHLIMLPKSAGAEAEYNEQFILCAGPALIKQTLQKIKPLLSDFITRS